MTVEYIFFEEKCQEEIECLRNVNNRYCLKILENVNYIFDLITRCQTLTETCHAQYTS